MRFSMLVAAALTISSIAVAGDPPRRGEKRVWEIDDAERIARRFDAGAAAIRRLKAIAAGRTEVRDDSNIVLGSENPELLLPWELMDHLKSVYFPDDERQREIGTRIRERAASIGMEKDFFDLLYAIARPLFDVSTENRRLQTRSRTLADDDPAHETIGNDIRRVNTRICPLRAAAVAEARRHFGREQFDRFLYQAVAPDAVVVSRVSPAGGELLLWVEGGCR